MRFILRLKHWQLFLVTFGLPILADFFGISEQGQTRTVDAILGIVAVSMVFGWIWTIANELHKQLPVGQKFKLWIFRILFLIALSILVFLFWAIENETTIGSDIFVPVLLLAIPVYLGLMIYIVLFAAKTLTTVEQGRLTTINEYGVEAFLIWMIPLGVWFIQPRLNKLTDNLDN